MSDDRRRTMFRLVDGEYVCLSCRNPGRWPGTLVPVPSDKVVECGVCGMIYRGHGKHKRPNLWVMYDATRGGFDV